jgi:transcriptional regulator with XRE-family HTH domain
VAPVRVSPYAVALGSDNSYLSYLGAMLAAKLIRDARRRHGLDQKGLARRAGTSQGQISKIERGAISPSIATLERLLGVMGERLELAAVPGPRPNLSVRELRHDHDVFTLEERVAHQAALSEALTTLAAAREDA